VHYVSRIGAYKYLLIVKSVPIKKELDSALRDYFKVVTILIIGVHN